MSVAVALRDGNFLKCFRFLRTQLQSTLDKMRLYLFSVQAADEIAVMIKEPLYALLGFYRRILTSLLILFFL